MSQAITHFAVGAALTALVVTFLVERRAYRTPEPLREAMGGMVEGATDE